MRQLPFHGTLWLTTFLQLLSLYEVRSWLSTASSVVPFCFLSFFLSAVTFRFFQPARKNRATTSEQRRLLGVTGSILAGQTILRYVALKYIGPLPTILGEYVGGLLGSLFLRPFTQRIDLSGKARIVFASSVVIYFVSQGWTSASCFPSSSIMNSRYLMYGFVSTKREEFIGPKDCGSLLPAMAVTLAGFLSSLGSSIAAQPPLKNMSRTRHFYLKYVVACLILAPWMALLMMFQRESVFVFPLVWPLSVTVGLGMGLAFFGDSFSVVAPASTWHYFVVLSCLMVLDLLYNVDVSHPGFLLCSMLLGIGVREVRYAAKGFTSDTCGDRSIFSALQAVSNRLGPPLRHILSDSKSRKLAMFLLINTSYMFVEFTCGFVTNSLGLISDACHMLFDCAALAIGLYAAYISRLQANSKFNYGYGRFEVVSGYANAVFLVLVAALILLESLERMLDPPDISTESLLFVSVGGLLVNIIGLIFFHEAHHRAHGGSCAHSDAHGHGTSLVQAGGAPSGCGENHVDFECDASETPQDEFCRGSASDASNTDKCFQHHEHTHFDSVVAKDKLQKPLILGHENHSCCASGQLQLTEGKHGHGGTHQHLDATRLPDQHHFSGQQPAKSLRDKSTEHTCSAVTCQLEEQVPEDHSDKHHHSDSLPPYEAQGASCQLETFVSQQAGNSDNGHPLSGHQHGCLHNEHHNVQDGHRAHQHHGHECEIRPSHNNLQSEEPLVHVQVHHHHMGHNSDDIHHGQSDLNMEGIFLHVLADTLGSVGVVVSALLLKYKGWSWADTACSFFSSIMIVCSAVPLLKSSTEILLLRVPRSAEWRIEAAVDQVKQLPGVHDCQRLHVWSMTSNETIASMHVHAKVSTDKQLVQSQVSKLLQASGIQDTTLQIEDAEEVSSFSSK